MSKIKILAISPDNHGVGKYRIINPYTHLQENFSEDFHIDIKMDVPNDDNEFYNYDIIVLHTAIHKTVSFQENIKRIDWLKRNNKIVVVDLDDYWDPDKNHPNYLNIIKAGVPKNKIELMKNASFVTTTTPIFRDSIIKKIGIKNVVVFPNAIDENELQFKSNKTNSDKIRFGWLGGSSHLHDLNLLKSGIQVIFDNYIEKVQFVLCGFDTRGTMSFLNKKTGKKETRKILPQETTWFLYEKFFTNNYKIIDKDYLTFLLSFTESPDYDDSNKPYRRIWTKDINKYAYNYNLFDVSLAPLVNNVFNNNKSQLKVIESGFHKKALIASECEPYTLDLIGLYDKGGTINPKGNALFVPEHKSHKLWGQHMKRLIDNPNMIEDLGNKLYETVYPKYSLMTVNKLRSEFFKTINK